MHPTKVHSAGRHDSEAGTLHETAAVSGCMIIVALEKAPLDTQSAGHVRKPLAWRAGHMRRAASPRRPTQRRRYDISDWPVLMVPTLAHVRAYNTSIPHNGAIARVALEREVDGVRSLPAGLRANDAAYDQG